MALIPSKPYDRETSWARLCEKISHQARHGLSKWAVTEKASGKNAATQPGVIFGLDTQRVDTMNAPRRQKNLFRAKGRRPVSAEWPTGTAGIRARAVTVDRPRAVTISRLRSHSCLWGQLLGHVTVHACTAGVVGDVLRRPVTDVEATAQAGQRLGLMLAGLAGMGVLPAAISGVLARYGPRRKPLGGCQFIVATWPGASS